MANIKKGFNFRNGVQVDDDNLKVSPTGLVGIGTTVPTEALDVRGNLVVTGVSSAATVQAGVVTVTTLNPTEIIGAGVSIVSGIVTASSGIITFFGDARFLQGMPTSQWEDVNTGFGVTSIYNTGGNVGIATSNPQFTLQIGANVNSFKDGVGISSFGDIKASGIITATTFIGNISGTGATFTSIAGNVTGNVTGLVNSSGISTFGGINATGRIVGSATSNVIPFLYSNLSDLPSASTYHGAFAHVHSQGKGYFAHAGNWWELVNKQQDGTVGTGVENYVIDRLVSTSTTATSLNVAGVSTFTGSLTANGSVDFNGDLDVDGHTELDNTTITGVVTFTEAKTPSAGNTLAIGADKLILRNRDGNEQFLEANDNGSVKIYYDFIPRLETSGVGVTITSQLDTTNIIASGIITASTELNSPLIGVGTDIPANDIQVRKTGNVEIQVTSDTGVAGLTVGRESGVSNTNNGEFRYGGGSGFNYSSAQSLDIINYGTGNFNYHISANNANAVEGDFHWHRGNNNSRLMTLTGIGGSLGIGITTPDSLLHVNGTSRFVANANFENNVIAGGVFIGTLQGNVIGGITGNVDGNTNATAGISTLFNFSVAGVATVANLDVSSFAIGEDPTQTGTNIVTLRQNDTQKIIVNDFGQIGIRTTTFLDGVVINAIMANMSILQLGVGVTSFDDGSVNFSDAGGPFLTNKRYMVPPKVTTAQRNVLSGSGGSGSGLLSGAFIYNTSLNKLQVYNGTAWETITSS